MYRRTKLIPEYIKTIEEIGGLYNKGSFQEGLNALEKAKVAEATHNLSVQRVGNFCLYATLIPGLIGSILLLLSLSYEVFFKFISPN